MKYRVVIQQDEDGVYVAEVPALPGCVTQGATREEAVEMRAKPSPPTWRACRITMNRFLHR